MWIEFFKGFRDYFLIAVAIVISYFFGKKNSREEAKINLQQVSIDESIQSEKKEQIWNNNSDDDKLEWMQKRFPSDNK